MANYLLPILIFPYLIKVVGIDKFGIISLAQAVALYLNVLIEYGFNYSATKFISKNRGDLKIINKTISSILILKLLFFCLVLIFYFIVINTIPTLKTNSFLFITGYLILFGMAIFPIWLYQGVEKLKHITIANFIGKIITILMIFILIKNPQDYIYVLLIYAIGSFITGFLGLVSIKLYGFSFGKISKEDLKFHLTNGYSIFISTLGINLYRNLNILLVGFFTSNSITGVYSVAEKLLKSIQMIVTPIMQALFPNTSIKINELSKKESKKYIQKLLKFLFIFLLFIYIITLFLSPLASKFFFKEFNELFLIIFLILSPVIIFGGLNYLLGVVGLINFGKDKLFTKSIFAGALINIFIGVLGGYYFGVYGISLALLFAEITVFLKLIKYFKSV
ncbi:MAG: oligosaccharide flippase family protein [Flavobacteriaceae bacterium]|nr:oligosaccharide flippase family protein [Flavobacteriaceae bacterium]